MNKSRSDNLDAQQWFLDFALGLPWFEIIGKVWKIGKKIMRGLAAEGVYEVLDYECKLELLDKNGENARIQKRELIRYLQDYITSYQDQAWGDGKILLDYQCSPGVPVDEYRLGHKTYKLVSLREFRNKDDIDEFNTEWKMRNGFLKTTGFWGTAINHRTKKITVKIVFPKGRFPRSASITESNLRRTRILGKEYQKTLADGRVMIIWEDPNPRFGEDYILHWEW